MALDPETRRDLPADAPCKPPPVAVAGELSPTLTLTEAPKTGTDPKDGKGKHRAGLPLEEGSVSEGALFHRLDEAAVSPVGLAATQAPARLPPLGVTATASATGTPAVDVASSASNAGVVAAAAATMPAAAAAASATSDITSGAGAAAAAVITAAGATAAAATATASASVAGSLSTRMAARRLDRRRSRVSDQVKQRVLQPVDERGLPADERGRHAPALDGELTRMREEREKRAERLLQQLEALSASTGSEIERQQSSALIPLHRRRAASAAPPVHPAADDAARLAQSVQSRAATTVQRLPLGWSEHAITNAPLPGEISTADAADTTLISLQAPSGAMVLSSAAMIAAGRVGSHALSSDSAENHEAARRASALLNMMRNRDSRRWLRAWLRQDGRVDKLLDILETAHPSVRQALIDVLSRLIGDDEEDCLVDHVSLMGGANAIVPSNGAPRGSSITKPVPVLDLGRLPLLMPMDCIEDITTSPAAPQCAR